ncbi:hypothetical protein BJK06_01315 [Curtobacterium sp. BH-2-1-1]|uniref:M23 family metallopeptidase n=1 Tax=Curtobacterium sp. BH-2-1-1 TaxID=1905847 RepID=UPI00089DDD7B|nr:M23 family metallopeptidase [Curtobacterium sp. BH-2-1-1]AOX64621.1 hypothetical protein BJK06_01315 [Curtobacterium sp. BH-2-1-1]
MSFRHPGPVVVAFLLLLCPLQHGIDSRATGSPIATSSPVRNDVARDRPTPATAEAPWVWPTGSRVVGRPWEAPADDYAAGHRGIDVAAPLGTVVVAVDDGTVTFAGQVAGRGVVTIDHGGGLRSTVDSVAPGVATGDTVAQGDAVGTVSVGHCPAADPCLHLGARLDDRYADPTPYLPAAAWPVLLPESAWTG